jgi:hypothetical protein
MPPASMMNWTTPNGPANIWGAPPAPCVDLNNGKPDPNNTNPLAPGYLAPNFVPRNSTAGEWILATGLTATQLLGVGMILWGIFAGHESLVDDHGHTVASAHPPFRFAVAPGVAGAFGPTAGLTFSALHL